MSSNTIKLALVGCGGISREHISGYRDLYGRGCREFVVSACCDISEAAAKTRADEIAQIQGSTPAVFTSVEELVRSGAAEAADVCTPHCFHHSSAIPLLEGGMHVMLEKPLGITVQASKLIIEAAEKAGRTLATAENVRRMPGPRSMHWALVQEKMIGEMRHADVQMFSNSQFNFTDPKFKWRGVKVLTGGGMIMDSGAHFTDMMIYLFGEPDRIWCQMHTYDAAPIKGAPMVGDVNVDIEDEWFAVMSFKSGMRVAWTYSRVQPAMDLAHGRYYGSQGMAEDLGFKFHAFQGGGQITLANGTVRSREWLEDEYMNSLSTEVKERLFPYGATDGFSIEVADFVRAIATNGQVDLDGVAGMESKALSEACFESATAGREVTYKEVLDGSADAFQKPIDEFWKLGAVPAMA